MGGIEKKYFGTDGIRGTVGKGPITPDFVLRLANAVGRVLVAAAAWAMLAVQLAAAWPAHLARRIPPHLVSRSPSVRL